MVNESSDPNPNVQDIVKKFLKDNGYDGLHNGDECGCGDEDLMCCGDTFSSCTVAFRCTDPKCDVDPDLSPQYCSMKPALCGYLNKGERIGNDHTKDGGQGTGNG